MIILNMLTPLSNDSVRLLLGMIPPHRCRHFFPCLIKFKYWMKIVLSTRKLLLNRLKIERFGYKRNVLPIGRCSEDHYRSERGDFWPRLQPLHRKENKQRFQTYGEHCEAEIIFAKYPSLSCTIIISVFFTWMFNFYSGPAIHLKCQKCAGQDVHYRHVARERGFHV